MTWRREDQPTVTPAAPEPKIPAVLPPKKEIKNVEPKHAVSNHHAATHSRKH